MIFHSWLLPLSIVFALGTIAKTTEELMFIAYFSLFGLLYLIGDVDFYSKQKSRNNGYRVLGSLGTIVLLMTLSFDWFWKDLRNKEFQFNEIIAEPEFLASAFISLLAIGLLYLNQKIKSLNQLKLLESTFILFIITFIIGLYSPLAVLLVNIYVFVIGILTIRDGAKQEHLGILNYGLLIITTLVICRFFDTNLSFILRGVLFVLVGAGFFVANYLMLKKRKANE
jgi:hypothetical protein